MIAGTRECFSSAAERRRHAFRWPTDVGRCTVVWGLSAAPPFGRSCVAAPRRGNRTKATMGADDSEAQGGARLPLSARAGLGRPIGKLRVRDRPGRLLGPDAYGLLAIAIVVIAFGELFGEDSGWGDGPGATQGADQGALQRRLPAHDRLPPRRDALLCHRGAPSWLVTSLIGGRPGARDSSWCRALPGLRSWLRWDFPWRWEMIGYRLLPTCSCLPWRALSGRVISVQFAAIRGLGLACRSQCSRSGLTSCCRSRATSCIASCR
jgi:hypothetical protein